MTDDMLDILCPERTIHDDEARSLLQYASGQHPESWHAFQFIRENCGIETACNFLRSTDDHRLHRLALVMPRLEREMEEQLHPKVQPMIAPDAKSVSIAMQGGAVHYGTTEMQEGPYIPEQHNKIH